jgi:hypothetical protein
MKTPKPRPDMETEDLKKHLRSRGLDPDATIAKAKARASEFLARQAALREEEAKNTNKSAFFKLLCKSAPPSEQPAKGTKPSRKRGGYAGKRTRPNTSEGAEEK